MKKTVLSFTTVIALLIGVSIYSSITGSIHVGVGELFRGLFTGTNDQVNVIRDLRFPRIIISIFAGAALAVSGALLQAVMRNALADSGVIGISSGAGFFSILAGTLFPSLFFQLSLIAFAGGALACSLVFILSWKSGFSPMRLILVGVAIHAIFSGLGQAFNFRGSYAVTSLNQATTSTLTLRTWNHVDLIAGYGSIGLLLAFCLCSWCNLLMLQDKTVHNLGYRVNNIRILIATVAVLLASVATAIGGLIVFVGLLVPHIGRQLVGHDYFKLIPFSALGGALLLLTADTLGRTIMAPNEIPASILLTVIGGPFLIFLLRKSDRIYGS